MSDLTDAEGSHSGRGWYRGIEDQDAPLSLNGPGPGLAA